MWQRIGVQERAGQNKDMVNINCINACDFQIINLKHNVKKKIKLGHRHKMLDLWQRIVKNDLVEKVRVQYVVKMTKLIMYKYGSLKESNINLNKYTLTNFSL